MSLQPRRPWRGARIVLGVTGGIAAYKSVQLARDLTRLGALVDVVTTRGATHFVAPLSFEAVTGRPVATDMFRADGAALHIGLGREADVVCVAPATADFLARAAQGRADDLLAATLLATEVPVLLCPAMNDRMAAHPQVRANLAHCRDVLGYRVAGPDVGPLAYGEGEGRGRMLEPAAIVEHVGRALGSEEAFAGRTVLVTAGPTREPLDPIRYLGNRSSGRMGYALARSAWRRGAEVVLVSGPVVLDDPVGAEVVRVETAREMERVVRERLPTADVAIFAAAVADFRPAEASDRKLKRKEAEDRPALRLAENPDVAADTRDVRPEDLVVVGFALETEALLENAREKLARKGFDLLVANEAGEGTGFEVETNQVTLLSRDGQAEAVPLRSKDEVAETILDRVAVLLRSRGDGSAGPEAM